MLKKRVIPIVLIDGFSVLKTINFDIRRNLGSPITVMKTYNTRNVDEMVILDIDASRQNRSFDKFIIKEITSDCFMPLTVGGGVNKCIDVETLLKNGADKVSINTAAIANKKFISESSSEFGSQCIVVSIDLVRKGNNYFIYSNGSVLTEINYLDWIKEVIDLGAGELLINDVTNDGLMSGCDYFLASSISAVSNIPVIYAGGISQPHEAAKLIQESNIDAVGISSIFHFTDYTPEDCRQAIKELGLPAR
jgi:imidazole glycerol-phosphate synthase subunit HisF